MVRPAIEDARRTIEEVLRYWTSHSTDLRRDPWRWRLWVPPAAMPRSGGQGSWACPRFRHHYVSGELVLL